MWRDVKKCFIWILSHSKTELRAQSKSNNTLKRSFDVLRLTLIKCTSCIGIMKGDKSQIRCIMIRHLGLFSASFTTQRNGFNPCGVPTILKIQFKLLPQSKWALTLQHFLHPPTFQFLHPEVSEEMSSLISYSSNCFFHFFLHFTVFLLVKCYIFVWRIQNAVSIDKLDNN